MPETPPNVLQFDAEEQENTHELARAAQAALSEKFRKMMIQLDVAIQNGDSSQCLFYTTEDILDAVASVFRLEQALKNGTSVDDVRTAVTHFAAWYQKKSAAIDSSVQAEAGSSPDAGSPESLMAQQRKLFNEMGADVDNMLNIVGLPLLSQ